MVHDAPTSGASSGRNQQPSCANQQATAGGRSRNNCAKRRPALGRHARPARNEVRAVAGHGRPPCATSAHGVARAVPRAMGRHTRRLPAFSRGNRHFTVGDGRLRLIRSTTGSKFPSSACTRRPDEISTNGNSSKSWPEQIPARGGGGGGGGRRRRLWERRRGREILNVEKPITVDVTVGEIVVEPTEEERHASAQLETTDDVDVIIEQVIAETSQLATDEGDQFFAETNVGEIVFGDTPVEKADDLEKWFDRSYEDFVSRDAEQLIVSTSDLDKGTGTAETVAREQQVPMFVEKGTVAESEGSKDVVVAKVIEKSVDSNQIDEELITLDDLLMQISDDMMLPSVTAAEITKIKSDLPVEIKEVHDQDWYYASLPKISATEKRKGALRGS
ncbi:hypothetical protein F511_19483 [Dorcoceras hygrometricum]|uniref:Uncharacterized protein n=1 Tax=Dorcoceras hygrometricum TaxID=472368 RepID=A0A2Z7B938_9LAMI|nr:hypothetical protein F511_19483 [Dorcoceras hygrometricum]